VTFSAHVELASRSRAYCSTLSFCAASSPHARAPAADAIGSSVSAMMAVIAAAQPEREDLQRLGVQDGAADLEAEALPPVELQQPRLEPRDVEVRLLAVLDAALIACMRSSAQLLVAATSAAISSGTMVRMGNIHILSRRPPPIRCGFT